MQRVGSMSSSQSAVRGWGVDFRNRATRGITLFVPGLLEFYIYGIISDPRMDLILPGCGWTSTLAPGATFAASCLYEPQPVSTQWMGVGFPHCAGQYRPGGSLCFGPDRWSCCICIEGGMILGGTLSSPGAADRRSHSLSTIIS